jgi:hypothetical protein
MQTTGTTFVEGNRVEWRDNGEVFRAMADAMRDARHSIHVDRSFTRVFGSRRGSVYACSFSATCDSTG